ncbi:response regulator transcription factor [Alkalihalobacillus pseudalcaliphilus]|uniref:response regulator transcription factor n=1 Tax=Alkalihalobacillus pseudalcaliphilus TaxID=79884 RepID=UPI00064DE7B5|nr:response regulator transcription factor [Alkalihalobacillus pseudalcaliphilus]KMK76238.1 DeoR faimly transcriptional regulator [Alkalihalobacillus pseudalcaliphilus]
MKDITILIADDEIEISQLVSVHLQKEGFQTVVAENGLDALERLKKHSVQLVILDIMMPGMDGFEVAKQIRETYTIPIIFLSAKTSEYDKVQGLILGADDYMTKPFSPIELIARVHAQLRRSLTFNQQNQQPSNDMVYGELTISPEKRIVQIFAETIDLTRKEFDILYLLARNPNKVFSVEHIFQSVWQDEFYEGANTVMVHIRTLRKKLQEDKRKNKFIKTVWGVGYTFNG